MCSDGTGNQPLPRRHQSGGGRNDEDTAPGEEP